ncbi:MAG: hypothetical protein ACHQ1D_00590 [Nitrososphaerales archaeon]
MKKTKYKSKPYKPYQPVEPPKEIECNDYLFGFESMTLQDILDKCKEYDPKTVILHLVESDDYDQDDPSDPGYISVGIRHLKENPNYNYYYKDFVRQSKQYEKDLEKYKVELKEYREWGKQQKLARETEQTEHELKLLEKLKKKYEEN